MNLSKRQLATTIGMSFLGRPYVWGGDDPVQGFDCSGFIIELLKSVGILPRSGDWTADALRELFIARKTATPKEGCLVFWMDTALAKAVHVEYCLDGELSIGASGGGSATLSAADAVKQNAYIMVRPFGTRPRLWGFVDPFSP